MAARSNIYDFMPHSINHLQKKIAEWNNSNKFFKAEEYSEHFGATAEKFATSSVELIKSAENTYKLFLALKADFDSAKINPAKYKDALKPLHALLMEGEDGVKLNIPSFDTAMIAEELKRAGY